MKIISYWTRSPVFNGNTPISTHFHSDFLSFIWSCDHAADRWRSTSDFQVCCRFWAVLSAKSSVAVPSAIHFTPHFKVQMASSRRNSSTPVPPLGTPFNTISCFSDQMAYPPNVPQHSRQIHQRGCSSPRSPSSTIQPGWTVLSVPGLSIVSADNDPN